MINEKSLTILLKAYLLISVGWGLKYLYDTFVAGDWAFWTIVSLLISVGVTLLYGYFFVTFEDTIRNKRRFFQAVIFISFCYTFTAVYSASTGLQGSRTFSGLRVSQLIVNSLMSVFAYGAFIIAVEKLFRLKEEVAAQQPPLQTPA